MSEKNSPAVGIFRHHQDDESEIKELHKSGYDMKKLSVFSIICVLANGAPLEERK